MNKKSILGIISLILVVVVIVVVALLSGGKSSNTANNSNETGTSVENKVNSDSKALVVYFSVPETNNANNMTRDEENSVIVVNGEVLGNTQYVAKLISDELDADLFRLEATNPYPTNHQELLNRAREEMDANARPEIKDMIDISDYDLIFIGYPIWNADLPPIVYTFLENNNFAGKTVVPFVTHGGSGLSGTPSKISNLLKDANVITNGYSIYRTNMEDAPKEVSAWLKEIDY